MADGLLVNAAGSAHSRGRAESPERSSKPCHSQRPRPQHWGPQTLQHEPASQQRRGTQPRHVNLILMMQNNNNNLNGF